MPSFVAAGPFPHHSLHLHPHPRLHHDCSSSIGLASQPLRLRHFRHRKPLAEFASVTIVVSRLRALLLHPLLLEALPLNHHP